MPLESHHKLSVRAKRQISSTEKPNTETIRERVHGLLNREKNEGRNKIMQESRDNRNKLKELLARNVPEKKILGEKKQERESGLHYRGIGASSVKNTDETMKMKVLGLKFGNESGEIALGAMHESQKDTPDGEARGSIGIGLTGTFKF